MKPAILLIFSLFLAFSGLARGSYVLPAVVVGKDTIPFIQLRKLHVVSKIMFASGYDESRFNKLKKDIASVYPYAKAASKVLVDLDRNMSRIDSRRARNRYLKQVENELKDKFSDPLKDMTVTQGQLLVKLIERETGRNCYTLIREMKSPVSAFFWQNVGAVFGYDLKTAYDPQQDRDIELIVSAMEGG